MLGARAGARTLLPSDESRAWRPPSRRPCSATASAPRESGAHSTSSARLLRSATTRPTDRGAADSRRLLWHDRQLRRRRFHPVMMAGVSFGTSETPSDPRRPNVLSDWRAGPVPSPWRPVAGHDAPRTPRLTTTTRCGPRSRAIALPRTPCSGSRAWSTTFGQRPRPSLPLPPPGCAERHGSRWSWLIACPRTSRAWLAAPWRVVDDAKSPCGWRLCATWTPLSSGCRSSKARGDRHLPGAFLDSLLARRRIPALLEHARRAGSLRPSGSSPTLGSTASLIGFSVLAAVGSALVFGFVPGPSSLPA